MARKTLNPDLPKVLLVDRPEPEPPQPKEAGSDVQITRLEFVANYIASSPEQKMALVTLPDKVMTVAEWRATWRTLLNSPAP